MWLKRSSRNCLPFASTGKRGSCSKVQPAAIIRKGGFRKSLFLLYQVWKLQHPMVTRRDQQIVGLHPSSLIRISPSVVMITPFLPPRRNNAKRIYILAGILSKLSSVRGYMHNFQEYAGKRARLTFKVMEGPDAGKFLFDNISLLHPKESKGMLLRRLRIAKRLGLITRGPNGEIIQQGGWKLLEGVVCWVDVAYKNLGGRTVPTIDNYELMEYGAHTQPAPPLPVAGAEVKPVVEESQEPTPPPPPATCESCPWYELNPWTHDPALGAWCHRRMEPLATGSPACEEFRRGEVPSRQPYEHVPAVPAVTSPASSGARSPARMPPLRGQPWTEPASRLGEVSEARARAFWLCDGV